MSKVTVVGAGNVGATCANVLAVNEVANQVCLIDIKEGFAEGKAMDIMQTAQLMGFDTIVEGVTNDYNKTAGSDVVIITSGLPRKPGMTREELIGVNAGIVKSVCDQVLKYSPNAILVVVSNPMDTMAYLTLHALGLPRNRVIGMGGALDSARLKYFLSQALKCNANDVDGFVIGGHGDTTMIPLTSYTTYKGINVSEFLSKEELENVVKSTMGRRCYADRSARYLRLDGSGCCCRFRGRGYHQGPEEDDSVLRCPRRRVWHEGYHHRCALYHR